MPHQPDARLTRGYHLQEGIGRASSAALEATLERSSRQRYDHAESVKQALYGPAPSKTDYNQWVAALRSELEEPPLRNPVREFQPPLNPVVANNIPLLRGAKRNANRVLLMESKVARLRTAQGSGQSTAVAAGACCSAPVLRDEEGQSEDEEWDYEPFESPMEFADLSPLREWTLRRAAIWTVLGHGDRRS